MLYRLIYASTLSDGVEHEEVFKIIRTAVLHNSDHNISGLLIYTKPWFIQALEGPRDVVNSLLFDRIAKDSRHHSLEIIDATETDHRHFPEWSMELFQEDTIPDSIMHSITNEGSLNPYNLNASDTIYIMRSVADRKRKLLKR